MGADTGQHSPTVAVPKNQCRLQSTP
jgi:hypothetical protein